MPRIRFTPADLAALLVGCSFAMAFVWSGVAHSEAEHRAPAPAPTRAAAPSWSLDPGDPAPETQEVDCWDDASCAAPGHTITEDDPRWNCRTMGNRVCGMPAPEELTACTAMGECIPDPSKAPTCTRDVADGPIPCLGSDADGIAVVDAFGTEHAGCALVVTTLEDSVAVCPDGFREES